MSHSTAQVKTDGGHITSISIIIIIIKKGQQCKAKREWYTPYQSEDPSPTIPTYRQKEEKGKKSRRLQQGQSSLGQQRSIGHALETRQSHTIEYGVCKIVPEGLQEGNKSPAVLQGSAARRCISVSMCDQSTACNLRWHMRSRQSTIKRVHWVTPDLIKHTQNCHGSTMKNGTLKHTSSQKPGTTDCSVQQFKVYQQLSTRLQNNTPKLAGQNPESISQEAINHETLARTSSRYQVFAKLLWKPSEDASQRSSLNQMSLPK